MEGSHYWLCALLCLGNAVESVTWPWVLKDIFPCLTIENHRHVANGSTVTKANKKAWLCMRVSFVALVMWDTLLENVILLNSLSFQTDLCHRRARCVMCVWETGWLRKRGTEKFGKVCFSKCPTPRWPFVPVILSRWSRAVWGGEEAHSWRWLHHSQGSTYLTTRHRAAPASWLT